MENAVKKLGEERHSKSFVGIPKRQPAFTERLSDETAHGREQSRRVTPGKRVSCSKNDQERGKRACQNKQDPGQLAGEFIDSRICRDRYALFHYGEQVPLIINPKVGHGRCGKIRYIEEFE